jgi:hypothetical protein
MTVQHSFTTRLALTRSPQAAFDAICNPRAWWSGDIEGSSHRKGDIFTYRYKHLHFSRQEVSELVQARRVVWKVLEAELNFVVDRSEWTGTSIAFDIVPRGTGSEVTFTHLGLAPTVECFDTCSMAWTALIQDSLRDVIETGSTTPLELDAR